jgi:hypothetical protein
MEWTWRSALEELKNDARLFRARVESERRGRALPKLGHLVSKEEYTRLTELLQAILPNQQTREAAFRKNRSDLTFITFIQLCGLIQWDYEHSFWDAFNALFGGKSEATVHRFVREIIIAPACRDLGIPLQHADVGWAVKTMYVTSVIGAAGIPPRRVGKVRDCVAWFYREHGHLLSAGLSPESFARLLAEYTGLARDEKEDLAAILYDAASKTSRLVDELKTRGYEAVDLAIPEVVRELEAVLGYRPEDIFGFRGREAFMSLVGELTQQIAPSELAPLVRHIQARIGAVRVIGPRGGRLDSSEIERPGRVAYGRYFLEFQGARREVHVVPRAAFSLDRMEWLLGNQAWEFFEWDNGLLGIWGPEPFEVIDSRRGEEPAQLVCAAGREGYLWAGTQAIGALLVCQTGGVERNRREPREGVILNPRLRLRPDRQGLELVLPSMVLHQPEHAGRTVVLKVNGRSVTDGRLVINRNGHLQFSQSRRYPLTGDEKELEVLVRLELNGAILFRHRPISLSEPAMLFRSNDRERIPPGDRRFVPEQVVLVSRRERPAWQLPAGAQIMGRSQFGPWHLIQIQLPRADASPVVLEAEGLVWSFATVEALKLELLTGPVPTGPWQGNDGLLINGQTADLVIGPGASVDDAADDLALCISTGRDRSCRAGLAELARLGLVRRGTSGEWLVSLRALQKRYLVAEPYGEYCVTLQDADFQELNQVEVSVLPPLVLRSEPFYAEETESWLTVESDRPELVVAESEEGALRTRIRFVPKLFSMPDGRLAAQTVQGDVTLKYPDATVTFTLTPTIAGLRVATLGTVLPATQLNHHQLLGGNLLIAGPAGHEVRLSCGLSNWSIDIPEGGILKFPLDQLAKGLSDQRTVLSVFLGDTQWAVIIHWPLTVTLQPDQISVSHTDRQTLQVALRPTATGPLNTQIEMSLNGLFDQLACETWILAELIENEAVLEVPQSIVEPEETLYLELRSGGQKLAEAEVPVTTTGEPLPPKHQPPEQLNDDELLRAAVSTKRAGDDKGFAKLVKEVHRRATQEVAAPLTPAPPSAHGPESLLRRLETMRRLNLEEASLLREMATAEALERYAKAWEEAEVSEEVGEAYATEVSRVLIGPLPSSLQRRLLDLPFAALHCAVIKASLMRQEVAAVGHLVELVHKGSLQPAEVVPWVEPGRVWIVQRLNAIGLEQPAVRRLLSVLASSNGTPPFIQVGALVTMDSRQGKVVSIKAAGKAVTYAPFPSIEVQVTVSVQGQAMTLSLDGKEVWLEHHSQSKAMICLYPDCGFVSSEREVFYPHLDTHRGWKKTFLARGTPKLRVRRVDWDNEPATRGKGHKPR